jgi:hypothetical protein
LRQAEGDDAESISIEFRLTLLRQLYGARIEAVRRTVSKHDRTAAIRALRNELKADMRSLVERNRIDRAAHREAKHRSWTSRDPSATK